ncbi:MAG: hypothetical protein H0W83_18310, partial [Planctomycetes bacterium]|nr:hypothetical protein [Planctomycetota bacterium]
MPIGALVAVPELQSEGPARTVSEQGTTTVIRFLATGAQMTQDTRQVVRYGLMPGTRITADVDGTPRAAEILPRRIERDAQSNLLVYTLRWNDDGAEARIREDAVAKVVASEPVDALATVAFHDLRPAHGSHRGPPEPYGPLTFCAREELLAWRDGAWLATGGVVG